MDFPKPNMLFLRFLHDVLGTIFKAYFRLKCNNMNRIATEVTNRGRPVIVIFNHTSILDMMLISWCVDLSLIRKVTFPGKKELFEDKRFSWFVHLAGAIPLDRDITDITAVKTLFHALKAGRVLVLAPEGTRSLDGQVHPFKMGFIKLAHKTNALILPIAIRGAFEAMPKGATLPRPKKIELAIGEVVDTNNHLKKRPSAEEYEAFLEQLRQTVIDLKETGVSCAEKEPSPTV